MTEQPRQRNENSNFWMVIATTCAVGAVFFFVSTSWGIGLSPDSGHYLKSARYMLGREQPDPRWTDPSEKQSSHFPPLYPMVLAGVCLPGADPQTAARWLNLALFLLNIILVGLIVRRATNSLSWIALATLFIATTPHSLAGHTIALSEALFLSLVLSSFLLLDHDQILLAAAAAGLAVLTRYAGIAIIPAAAIAIAISSRGWKKAMSFIAVSMTPLVIVTIANKLKTGSAVNRETAIHPPGLHHFNEAMVTICQWVLPPQMSHAKLVLAGLLISVALLVAIVFSLRDKREMVLALFALCYVIVLGLSISFVDFHTRLDERLLLPLLFCAVIVFASALHRLAIRRTVVAAARVIVLISLARGALATRSARRDGIGYASPVWEQSPTVAAISQVPPDQVSFSNAADVVYLVARRQAAPVPAKINPTSLLPNPDYSMQLEAMRTQLMHQRAIVICFSRFESKRPYYPTARELEEAMELRERWRGTDGVVLESSASSDVGLRPDR